MGKTETNPIYTTESPKSIGIGNTKICAELVINKKGRGSRIAAKIRRTRSKLFEKQLHPLDHLTTSRLLGNYMFLRYTVSEKSYHPI